MVSHTFDSPNSHDRLEVSYDDDADRAVLNLLMIDDVTENLQLLRRLITQLRETDVILVGARSRQRFMLPDDSTCYRDMSHRRENLVYCDIDHFEEFYQKNLKRLVTLQNIYVPEPVSEDGWTVVADPKKIRKQRYTEIGRQVDLLCADWAALA